MCAARNLELCDASGYNVQPLVTLVEPTFDARDLSLKGFGFRARIVLRAVSELICNHGRSTDNCVHD